MLDRLIRSLIYEGQPTCMKILDITTINDTDV